MDILLFGDQTADQISLLRRCLLCKGNSIVSAFLERVSSALREEIQQLPQLQRKGFPDFLGIGDLIDRYPQMRLRCPEIDSALLTISQLAHYMSELEESASEWPEIHSTRFVGLCTGLLAAAAVASARSLSELLPLAVETARIAFRTGVCVTNIKYVLQGISDEQAAWSIFVTDMSERTAQSRIDEFHRQRDIPVANHAYVSAVSTTAVTISGPPHTTMSLFATSAELKHAHYISLPIFAPFHAAHLFTEADVDAIIDDRAKLTFQQFRPLGKVHSASTGKCHKAISTFELMRVVLHEIIRCPMRWDLILEEVVAKIAIAEHSACRVFALGNTNLMNSLFSALKAGSQKDISVKDHTSWTPSVQSSNGHTQSDKIAIIGMSGRFPDADSHEALWNLLTGGLDVHREIPIDRFDAQAHCDPSGKGRNKSHTPYGCFINEPGLFDPRFFNMSPREAAQTDPMGRLAIVTAYEALEMSGYVPNRTHSTKRHRIGTFYGQTSDDWREINAAEDIDTYFITGGVRAFAPGRINYHFKFSGPSISVDTACSSSTAAIQIACTSLWAGDVDMACAGGMNVLTNPDIFAGLSKGQFLSKTGSCKTFDDDADGYCRGDGVATVILKRYEDAIADRDKILGCILAAGTNHSAEAVSITHPHADAQEFLYKKVLADAGVDAHDVSYVEMHGTGTQAGDAIEMTSVTNVFAPTSRYRKSDQPLHLGALKANIGHGEAASGISSLIKILMMMQENLIPPNVGIKGKLNKNFARDFQERNIHIPTDVVPFPRQVGKKRKILLNNFSAAGGNTAILLEDPPLRHTTLDTDPRSYHVITVSARAISSLKRNIHQLVNYLDENPTVELSSLSYTTTARRMHHSYRESVAASTVAQIKAGFTAQTKDTYSPVSATTTPVAFCFTGQGSQYTGVALTLYKDLPSFRKSIHTLEKIAITQGLPSFLPLITGNIEISALSPVVVQLGMVCIQIALAWMWMGWGIQPQVVVGHSLGEYAALHVAGVLSASDVIHLVGQRAFLLVRKCTAFSHGMLAVRSDEPTIVKVLGAQTPEVACKNGPAETVLCGTAEAMTRANEDLASAGVKSTLLRLPFAFHSAQIEAIVQDFECIAKSVTFGKPAVPILSPLTGQVIHKQGIIDSNYLVRHARETVDFMTAVRTGKAEGLITGRTAWLEIGAHPVCLSMLRASITDSLLSLPSLRRGEDAWKTVTGTVRSLYLAGAPINFDEYHRNFNNAHELLVLPTYQFENKNYWLDYHNNWTLTKGENQFSKVMEQKSKDDSDFSTTSCQRIVHEKLTAQSATIVFQTDLADPKLAIAVTGHLVNQNPLCPSSLYADQALTVASFLHRKLHPGAMDPGLNVCSMEVPKPLIARSPPPPDGQHMQIEATTALGSNKVNVRYRSVTAKGKVISEHAHCVVKYEDVHSWTEDWQMISFMVRNQIDILKQKVESGKAHKVLRGMAYKLFKQFVDYALPYRGMSEVIFDAKEAEGTAKVDFQDDKSHGVYKCPPFWIDSLAHISGFICNGTDLIDSDRYLYISHGWTGMRFLRPFSPNKTYESYVRMQARPGNIRAGDVYIFDGDEIVGMVTGLKFQQLERRIMDVMLPRPKATAIPSGFESSQSPSRGINATESSTKMIDRTSKTPFESRQEGKALSARAMNIIAEECAVDIEELVDDAEFGNLGVDSLLSLTISARLREELELDIPSNLFIDQPTISALKKYLDAPISTSVPEASSSTSEADSEGASPDTETNNTTPSTPPSVSDDDEADTRSKKPTNGELGTSSVRTVVAETMGLNPSELTDKTELSKMGLDSLMNLAVLSEIRERIGIELPSTFFIDNPTIEEVEKNMRMRQLLTTEDAPQQELRGHGEPPPSRHKTQKQLHSGSQQHGPLSPDSEGLPNATSVVLQGSVKTATKKLFLFPDGSGSATSYVSIGSVAPDVCLIGLNCPFMKTPERFTIGIEGVSTLYLREVKRRQAEGPYFFGGWSAGGVIAYEVCLQMLAQGDAVEKLILLDSPCPVNLEPLPARLHQFFDSIGLLGSGGKGSSPDWLLPHFESSIKALDAYRPVPMRSGAAPDTLAVWATKGVCGKPGDPRPPPAKDEDPRPMKWLLDNRTDFGDNGWAELLGDMISFETIDANHFTMMTSANGIELAALIRRGLRIV